MSVLTDQGPSTLRQRDPDTGLLSRVQGFS